MKIALILPGTIWFAPYVRIYTKIMDEQQVDYSIISWNRDGKDEKEGIQYGKRINVNNGAASLRDYLQYVKFICKIVKEEHFDRLVVFGPQMACLLFFLLLGFKKKFIIDYRDLSIEQKPILKQLFGLITKWSFANVISSPGFKKYLPKRDYLLSHNFDIETVRSVIDDKSEKQNDDNSQIDVLTIGGIRDYSSNIEVVKALANQEGFFMRFVGSGGAVTPIKSYVEEKKIQNISFTGYYKKVDEPSFIKTATFLNIFYPRVKTHDTALSNRFYNSLIYKKPMIVTKDTTQGDFAEQYGVGVAIEDCKNLPTILQDFLKHDYICYVQQCNILLKSFLNDYQVFENNIIEFLFNNRGRIQQEHILD